MPTPRRARANKRALPGSTALEILHGILKDSLRELNETEKMKLQKLMELNKFVEFISDQMRKIVDASQELAAREEASDDPDTVKVSITWQRPDTTSLDEDGKVIVLETRSRKHNRISLGTEMKIAENCLEEIRNKKLMDQSAFEQVDKMTNETMNTLARVLRALAAMRPDAATKS